MSAFVNRQRADARAIWIMLEMGAGKVTWDERVNQGCIYFLAKVLCVRIIYIHERPWMDSLALKGTALMLNTPPALSGVCQKTTWVNFAVADLSFHSSIQAQNFFFIVAVHKIKKDFVQIYDYQILKESNPKSQHFTCKVTH